VLLSLFEGASCAQATTGWVASVAGGSTYCQIEKVMVHSDASLNFLMFIGHWIGPKGLSSEVNTNADSEVNNNAELVLDIDVKKQV
jgi:hypothetical protein